MLKAKRSLFAVLSCLLVFLASAWGASTNPKKITVYMGPVPLARELEAAFEAEHGDVLTVVSGPWCRKVRAELAAGDIKADVLYGADPSFYLLLRNFDQLLFYDLTKFEALKPEYRQTGDGFGWANGRYAVILYNKGFVSPENAPQTWDDLLDPKWKGKVVIGDPLLCSAAFAVVCSLVQWHGFDWDYIEGLKENGVLLTDSSAKVSEVVATGEAWIGIGVHDAAVRIIRRAKKQGVESPLAVVWPEDGAIAIPRPIAIVRDANRPAESTALAKAFVSFALSTQGQKIASKYGFVPVRTDIGGVEELPEEIKIITPDWEWMCRHNHVLRDKWESIMCGE